MVKIFMSLKSYAIVAAALFLSASAANYYLDLGWFGRYAKAAVGLALLFVLFVVKEFGNRGDRGMS
ncbi:MAG: hypothetical protein RLZZ393_2090 [Pseudomonadota bacterium]|jgi:hypothetical protein